MATEAIVVVLRRLELAVITSAEAALTIAVVVVAVAPVNTDMERSAGIADE